MESLRWTFPSNGRSKRIRLIDWLIVMPVPCRSFFGAQLLICRKARADPGDRSRDRACRGFRGRRSGLAASRVIN